MKEFERLKKYLINISTVYLKEQYSVHPDYIMTYDDWQVDGFLNGEMSHEDVYDCSQYIAIGNIDWTKVVVFKRLKRW